VLMGNYIQDGHAPTPLWTKVQALRANTSSTEKWIGMVSELLANQTDLNAEVRDEENRTTLMWAILAGYPDIVDALIDAGMNVNATDEDGYTAMHHAVWYLSEDLVAKLIEANIDLNAKSLGNGEQAGLTALHLAVYHTQFNQSYDFGMEAARMLIAGGANINAQSNIGTTPILIAIYYPEDPYPYSDDGIVWPTTANVVKMLLSFDAAPVNLNFKTRIPTTNEAGEDEMTLWQWVVMYEDSKPEIYAVMFKKICGWIDTSWTNPAGGDGMQWPTRESCVAAGMVAKKRQILTLPGRIA